MNYIHRIIIITLVGVVTGNGQIIRPNALFQPVVAERGMVVSAEASASQAGLEVLREGGNAVDAAVTMGFTLAVTLPRAGNLGGGGFMIIHDADSNETVALDYREVSPSQAYRRMFLDENGEADPSKSRYSPLAVGVPGTVAGLITALKRYGTIPLDRALAPAIQLAEDGFEISSALADSLATLHEANHLNDVAKQVYFDENGQPPRPGQRLVQTALADTLKQIAEQGRDGFYTGPVARSIVHTLQRDGGVMTLEDLTDYEPVWRKPISIQFRGSEIHSMPPPSSGGIHIAQMLRLASAYPLREWGHNSHKSVHILTEIMKRAYADRSKHLGDPKFYDVPDQALFSESYLDHLRNTITMGLPRPSSEIGPGNPREYYESPQTTHFSVVDKAGNAVSNTYTLNFSYGSGIMAEDTGVLLNNEMDDFSAKPGVPNAYGLIGGEANAVEPRKRMLSSMSPTIVLKDNEVFLVTGSPGGSRIITTVLQIALNIVEFSMNPAEANRAPRFHHQWLPDILYVERGFPVDTRKALENMGYRVKTSETIGAAQTILRTDNKLYGSSDPRRKGGTVLGLD